MGLMDIAKADLAKITSDRNDWSRNITFTTPDNLKSIVVGGTHTKHHHGINGETGQIVNVKNASVSVSESQFVGYTVRNAYGEVFMRDHKVSVVDSTGVVCNYVVREWRPDEALGFIVFMLGDLE